MWPQLLTLLETFESILMANPRVLRIVITNTPPNLFTWLGKLKSTVYVKAISYRIPAYKKFLAEHNRTSSDIKSVKSLPITTKDTYILKYPLQERALDGKLPNAGNIDESAGSTGKATMWVRSFQEEKKLNKLVTFALDYTFNSFHKRNVVVLNCWSNGPWATGIKFAFIAQHSTLVKAIGTNKENVIETIQTLGKNFEYVICGYPPFTKEVIDYGEEKGMVWSDYRVNIVTGGEGFSEGWRDFMREKIKGSQGEVYSAYGASDIDIGVAFETDFTIAVRKKLTEDVMVRTDALGSDKVPLFVGQYNPLIYYIEEHQTGELLFTLMNKDTASPKIRYNLKDSGKLLSYNEAMAILSPPERKKYQSKSMKLPFVVIYGRSDGTISLDGANIYPADIQDALYTSKIGKFVHSFLLETTYSTDKSMAFSINIELTQNANKILPTEVTEVQHHVIQHLSKVNKDFKESYSNNKNSLTPQIYIHEYDAKLFEQNKSKIKHVYYHKPTENKS